MNRRRDVPRELSEPFFRVSSFDDDDVTRSTYSQGTRNCTAKGEKAKEVRKTVSIRNQFDKGHCWKMQDLVTQPIAGISDLAVTKVTYQ